MAKGKKSVQAPVAESESEEESLQMMGDEFPSEEGEYDMEEGEESMDDDERMVDGMSSGEEAPELEGEMGEGDEEGDEYESDSDEE